MNRYVLATIAGVAAAGATVAVVEAIGHSVYPPPPGIDVNDPESIAQIINTLPFGAVLFVVVAWVTGAFTGGLIATWICKPASAVPALLVGAAVLLATAATLFMIPHPLWMTLAGLALPVPVAWLAARLMMAT